MHLSESSCSKCLIGNLLKLTTKTLSTLRGTKKNKGYINLIISTPPIRRKHFVIPIRRGLERSLITFFMRP